MARWSHLGAWVRWWKTHTEWIYISWIKGETEEGFPPWAGFYHQCEHLSQHKLRLLKLCSHVLWELQPLQLPASLDQPRMKAPGSGATLAGIAIAEPRSGEWQALKLCVWPCSSGMWENTLPFDINKSPQARSCSMLSISGYWLENRASWENPKVLWNHFHDTMWYQSGMLHV